MQSRTKLGLALVATPLGVIAAAPAAMAADATVGWAPHPSCQPNGYVKIVLGLGQVSAWADTGHCSNITNGKAVRLVIKNPAGAVIATAPANRVVKTGTTTTYYQAVTDTRAQLGAAGRYQACAQLSGSPEVCTGVNK